VSMECPNCKRTLLPARTRESSPAIDGLKCAHCDKMFTLNASHHLIPYNPFENITLTQIASHSPAANTPDKKADPPAQHSVEERLIDATNQDRAAAGKPPLGKADPRKKTYKLSLEQKEEIKRRLLAGEFVGGIAADFRVVDESIYIIRRKLGIHGRLPKSAARKQCVLKAKSKDLSPTPAHYLAIRAIIIQKAANGFILELHREEGEFDPAKDLRIFPDFKTVVDWLQG